MTVIFLFLPRAESVLKTKPTHLTEIQADARVDFYAQTHLCQTIDSHYCSVIQEPFSQAFTQQDIIIGIAKVSECTNEPRHVISNNVVF